jgi:GntR family transcriptional regulator
MEPMTDRNLDKTTLKLEPSSPEPLYNQIKNAILHYIEENDLQSEDKLPSERELCEFFSVSRLTVRRAVDELIRLGVVFRRPGKGLYISYPKLQQRLLIVTSFSEAVAALGHTPGARLLDMELIEGSAKVCKEMGLPAGAQLLRTHRLRLVDNIPFSVCTSCLNYELLGGIEKELGQQNLYHLIENRYGVELAKTNSQLEATLADHAMAALLDIKPGAPLFLMSGVVCSPDGQPVEYFEAYYRGDRMRFITESD